MTGEELVKKIQNGETQYVSELWLMYERWISWRAFKAYDKCQERCHRLGVEYEDLFQDAYFEFIKAVDTYPEDADYKFITHLNVYLKTAFAKSLGYRTTGDEKRARMILSSSSMQEAIASNSGGDSVTYEDHLPDKRAEQELDFVIGDDEQTNTHDDLQEVIADLPDEQAKLITENYYNNKSLKKIAEDWQIPVGRLTKLRQDALGTLRQDKRLEKYNRFRREKQRLMDINELGYGLGKFRDHQMSSQEAYMIRLEQLEKDYGIK